MPKKPNFLGGMQNYNPDDGKYEPALVGADGKVPDSFKSFKKGDEKNESFDEINDKRMGKKKSEKKKDEDKKEPKDEKKPEDVEELEVNEDKISEALADYQWQVTDKTTAGEYAEETAKKLGISKEKVFDVIKKQAPNEIKESSNMSKIISAFENGEEFKDEEQVESVDVEKQGYDEAIKLNNYEKAKELYDDVVGKDEKKAEGIKKALDEMSKNFDKSQKDEPKEKSLNDYTDELFEKVGVKTFNSKKYKNKEGEIVEIRRFGEGKSAIRYNETTDKVEQVWYNGERIL